MRALKQDEGTYIHQDLILQAPRENTSKAYAQDVKGYRQAMSTSIINKELVLTYLKQLQQAGYKWNTIKRIAYSLKPEGIAQELKGLKNRAFKADSSKVIPKKARPLLKVDLITALEAEVSDRDRLIVLLMYFGALRVSEVVSLKKQDFIRGENYYLLTLATSKNLERGETLQKKYPHKSPAHICPFTALDNYLEKLPAQAYLFAGKGGGHISTRAIQDMVKRVLGESYQSHSLRMGAITEGFAAGCTISQLKHLSGHKSISALMEYDSTDFLNNNAVDSL